MKVSDFSTRLEKILSIRNMRQIDLADKTGISRALISAWINKKALAKQDKLTILADVLKVSEPWLMGYDVNMDGTDKVIDLSTRDCKIIKIPVLGQISAGLPLYVEQNLLGYDFAPMQDLQEDYQYFYLKVHGDSMNKKFNDGDLVLVQKNNVIKDGDIAIVLVDNNDATVKKFRRKDNLIILEPMSNNPVHQIQIYDINKTDIKIIGKVVKYVCNI